MIKCAIHLYCVAGEAPEAITVINGIAVCYDCMGYVAGVDYFRTAIRAYRGSHPETQ